MVKAGFLSAVSVGFRPLEFEWATEKSRMGGINYRRCELLECSICSVPANAHALIQGKSIGEARQSRLASLTTLPEFARKLKATMFERDHPEPIADPRLLEQWRLAVEDNL
jgi:phage head maturation protease